MKKLKEQISCRGKTNRKARDRLRTARFILKKEKEKGLKQMDLMERTERTQREIAHLQESREIAERALDELTDKHEKAQDELNKLGLGHYLERRELESVIDGHEMELAKQKDLVEALNRELDDQDHELSLERSRYVKHTRVLRELYEQERQYMPKGIRIRRRR